MERARSHKDLIVWQKAMDMVVMIYKMTEHFPRSEVYGLTSQLRRAAISVPATRAVLPETTPASLP